MEWKRVKLGNENVRRKKYSRFSCKTAYLFLSSFHRRLFLRQNFLREAVVGYKHYAKKLIRKNIRPYRRSPFDQKGLFCINPRTKGTVSISWTQKLVLEIIKFLFRHRQSIGEVFFVFQRLEIIEALRHYFRKSLSIDLPLTNLHILSPSNSSF